MISVSREVALPRMPTQLANGEGRTEQGSNRHVHLFRSAGVLGTARWKDTLRTEGDPSGRQHRVSSAVDPAGVGEGRSTAEAG